MHENYIKELQRGSYSDFNNLYNLYVDRLYGFVYNLTRSSDMTEEIVQEVFLKICIRNIPLWNQESWKNYFVFG